MNILIAMMIGGIVIKPYVILISQNDAKRKFALDRTYTLIQDSCDYTFNTADIVQVDGAFFPSFEYQYPDWVEDKEPFIALWTNYYD